MAHEQEGQSPQLPLTDNGIGQTAAHQNSAPPRWRLIPVIMASAFVGAVGGLYFQPPGLQAFFSATGLEPGGGTDTPIAQAIQRVSMQEEVAVVSEGDIVALGRILPRGDVYSIATPFGSGDARLEAMKVAIGDRVQAGDVLAILDNRGQLQHALDAALADLQVREAILRQTQDTVRASREEAVAALDRAITTAEQAQIELDRLTPLLERGVTTQSSFDQAVSRAEEAARDVERNRATLSRFQGNGDGVQVDVLVAEANLGAARVEVARAQSDLESSIVRAPIDGVILDVNVQVGERPGTEGILDLGDTRQMTIEAEVYQTLIGRVAVGDPVIATADALDAPLTGQVQAIGLEIGRQSITSDDPAANTDARVVDVIVALDAESSARAERLTNLQTIVRIDAGTAR